MSTENIISPAPAQQRYPSRVTPHDGEVEIPTYSYECDCGASFDRVLPLADYNAPQTCECGKTATKVISAPQLMISQDIHYQSPIDGRPITSMRARADDLARSNCVPYDPGQRQDYDRRIKESEAALDRAIDETVEKHIETMPGEKRERLQAELDSGLTAEPERRTADKASIKRTVSHA